MTYVLYYLELQKQLAASKRSSQKPLLDAPRDQDLNSRRPGQVLVGVGAMDQAETKPLGGTLKPITIHEVLVEDGEEMNFDWPRSPQIERIKTGLTEIALAVLLFVGLVAFCLGRF